MSTHNICFSGEIKNYQYFVLEKRILSGIMRLVCIRLNRVNFSYVL